MTDSDEILAALLRGEASFMPVGGYKGYSYATVVEILSAALAQGNYMKMLTGIAADGSKKPHGLGHYFMVFDPEAFMGIDAFKKTAGDILRALRASKVAPGRERIYTAGEMEYLKWLDRRDKGVPVGESVQRELAAVRDKLGLSQYVFPFERETSAEMNPDK